MDRVDLGVVALDVERGDGGGRTVDVHDDLLVAAVDADDVAVRVFPGDAQPHAPTLGVPGGQLVTGVVDDLDRVADDRHGRRALERLDGPIGTRIQRVQLIGQHPAAHHQPGTVGVEPLDHLGHEGVGAGQVVQRQVLAHRDAAAQVAALAGDRRHVATLAAVGARRAVGVVAVLAGEDRGVVGLAEGATAQLLGQVVERGHREGVQSAGDVLAAGAFDGAVLVREVVEGRLVLDRGAGHATERSRSEGHLGAVVRRKVAHQRVRHVVTGGGELLRLDIQHGIQQKLLKGEFEQWTDNLLALNTDNPMLRY